MPIPDGPTTSTTTYAHPTDGILRRAHRWLTVFGGIYVLLLVLVAIPFFQLQSVSNLDASFDTDSSSR
jgi:hypothetical protein